MDRNTACAGAAGALALFLVTVVGARVQAADRRALEDLRSALARLEAQEPPSPPRAQPSEPDPELVAALDGLRERLARLEASAARVPAAAEALVAVPAEAAAPAPVAEPRAGARRELEALLARLVAADWDFRGEEGAMERFLALARDDGLLDELLAELEDALAAAPEDTALRMQLADAYVAKLMTVAGPEQGLWGGRAEEQWEAVLELDERHWGAHARLGTNYSFYPPVMGRTGDAIRHLERARELQRDLPAVPEHVQTYLFLGRLHAREGARDEARAVLREGCRRHPDARELEQALAELDG